MSSNCVSRRYVLLGPLALAGCGFVPVFQDSADLRGAFSYQTDDDAFGFAMSSQFSRRLGTAETARFVIKASAQTSERAAAITAEGDTSRLNVIGTSSWSIVDAATGNQMTTGEVSAFTSYSATASTVATQASRDDARNRLAVILADMIVTRVLAQSGSLS